MQIEYRLFGRACKGRQRKVTAHENAHITETSKCSVSTSENWKTNQTPLLFAQYIREDASNCASKWSWLRTLYHETAFVPEDEQVSNYAFGLHVIPKDQA